MRNQRGQSLVLSLLFLAVLVGLAAAVLDVGSWYRADRKLQANADAAALAGAQDLPGNPATARAKALDYATTNDGGVAAGDITVRSTTTPNDTIEVHAERPAPGFFAKLFGFNSVTIRAQAAAKTHALGRAKFAAPVAIDERHPMLQCGRSCWNSSNPTTLDFFKVGPGAFRLINIDDSHGGTGSQTLGDWINNGLDAFMDKDHWYYSDPGMKPSSANVQKALDDRDETELLFPVYRSVRAQGAGFEYYVVGFAVFHLTGYSIHGSSDSRLYGYFVDMVWEGVQGESGGDPDFGAKAVELIQ